MKDLISGVYASSLVETHLVPSQTFSSLVLQHISSLHLTEVYQWVPGVWINNKYFTEQNAMLWQFTAEYFAPLQWLLRVIKIGHSDGLLYSLCHFLLNKRSRKIIPRFDLVYTGKTAAVGGITQTSPAWASPLNYIQYSYISCESALSFLFSQLYSRDIILYHTFAVLLKYLIFVNFLTNQSLAYPVIHP